MDFFLFLREDLIWSGGKARIGKFFIYRVCCCSIQVNIHLEWINTSYFLQQKNLDEIRLEPTTLRVAISALRLGSIDPTE